MLKFYFNFSPNPMKVALMLEEIGLDYEPIPIDVRKGEQFSPEFLALNPNGKVPVIDDDGVIVFDSNAILLHLAEKTGRFLPPRTQSQRGELLSWLMFAASGLGPYCGQAVHFRFFAPQPQAYAKERYEYEARRHFTVLDERLAQRAYVLGESFTIVDMDVWGWASLMQFVLGKEAWAEFPNLKRLVDEIDARPAAQRVAALRERFTFKSEMDAEARANMFRHIQPAG